MPDSINTAFGLCIKRPPMIQGMSVDQFIRANADLTWLHQNEIWEYMDIEEGQEE